MKITFFGQLGLPTGLSAGATAKTELAGLPHGSRVEALSRQFVQDGHSVSVLGAYPYVTAGNYHGVKLIRIPSLNPEKPGGWVFLTLGLLYLLAKRPNVIHVHTWPAALLFSLTRWLFRDTRIVWTIDSLPTAQRWHKKWILQTINYKLQTSLTAPTRTIQYRLLVEYGIKAHYIPDGYHESAAPDIELSHFGLKKGQYCLAIGTSDSALRWVKKTYQGAKTTKKLVALTPSPPRARQTLVNNAAAIIIADDTVSSTDLLEAMHNQKAIIAPVWPLYQEILATTGQYYAPRDAAGLMQAINNVAANAKAQKRWGDAAASRARRHFTWPRLAEEYSVLYAPQVRLVPLDSIYVSHIPQSVSLQS